MSDSFGYSSKCFACGTVIAAVDEETHQIMLANHIIEDHSEEAHPDLLEECREVLDE